jgi:putative NADH-flavin reductase
MDETPLFQLPPVERAGRYRQLAEEMRDRATSAATEESRIGYLNMAVEWLDMADRLEAQHGKISVVVDAELALLLRNPSPE